MLRTIRQKVIAASFVVFLLACASVGTGLWVTANLTDGLQNTQRAAAILRNHMEADMMHDALRADVLSALLESSGASNVDPAAIEKDAAEDAANFRKAIADNKTLARDPEIRKVLDTLAIPLEAYVAAAEDLVKSPPKDLAASASRLKSFLEQFSILEVAMADASDRIERMGADISDEARARAAAGRDILLVALALAAAFALLLALLGGRMVVRPIRSLAADMRLLATGKLNIRLTGAERRDEVGEIGRAVRDFQNFLARQARTEAETIEGRRLKDREVADRQAAIDGAKAEDLRAFVHGVEASFERLAAGDLTVRMDGAVAPEFEPIRQRFNATVGQLEETIGSVVGAVGTMRVGLTEITVAAGDLSQRTEQQAASLEETVAALSEVMRGVEATAQSADDAKAAATLAQLEAGKGGEVVAKVVSAMAGIEQSSHKIGSIISVIDEIAFQTNLLALNAGVEAARAGEAGRGFAVVAQEVRGLAQRSAEAAKEIKSLISTSASQVGQGVELVSASGRSLERIVAQVEGVSRMIADMARGAREQAVSLKEVATAADQMDKVTQQNAAMVEETTAAAQSLSGETQELASLTERFRTGGTAPAQAARSGARALPATLPVSMPAPMRPAPARQPAPSRKMRQTHQAQPSNDAWEEF